MIDSIWVWLKRYALATKHLLFVVATQHSSFVHKEDGMSPRLGMHGRMYRMQGDIRALLVNLTVPFL